VSVIDTHCMGMNCIGAQAIALAGLFRVGDRGIIFYRFSICTFFEKKVL